MILLCLTPSLELRPQGLRTVFHLQARRELTLEAKA